MNPFYSMNNEMKQESYYSYDSYHQHQSIKPTQIKTQKQLQKSKKWEIQEPKRHYQQQH